jgi:hypothetical protein
MKQRACHGQGGASRFSLWDRVVISHLGDTTQTRRVPDRYGLPLRRISAAQWTVCVQSAAGFKPTPSCS